MKTNFSLVLRSATVGFVALLLGACSTIDSRIKEKSATFAAQDAATQESIRKGVVGVGKPDRKIHRRSKEGDSETWLYNNYYQDYAGTARVGYRRYVVVDQRTGLASVYIEPVYTNVYTEHTEARIRVSFKNGKVSVIEQAKG